MYGNRVRLDQSMTKLGSWLVPFHFFLFSVNCNVYKTRYNFINPEGYSCARDFSKVTTLLKKNNKNKNNMVIKVKCKKC